MNALFRFLVLAVLIGNVPSNEWFQTSVRKVMNAVLNSYSTAKRLRVGTAIPNTGESSRAVWSAK